jgi:hypothetical protein
MSRTRSPRFRIFLQTTINSHLCYLCQLCFPFRYCSTLRCRCDDEISIGAGLEEFRHALKLTRNDGDIRLSLTRARIVILIPLSKACLTRNPSFLNKLNERPCRSTRFVCREWSQATLTPSWLPICLEKAGGMQTILSRPSDGSFGVFLRRCVSSQSRRHHFERFHHVRRVDLYTK